MSVAVATIVLAEALATASASTLAVPAYKQSRFLGPCRLDIERAGTTGGGTVYGAYLPGPSSADTVYCRGLGDGSTVTLQTAIPYVALSNNNYLIRVSKSGRTGTVSTTAGSATITGSSTAFTTELRVGDEVLINGEVKRIISITSSTVATAESAYVNTNSAVAISLIDGFLAPTTDFTVSDVGGFALITFGDAAKVPVGCLIEVCKVTPVALFTFATAVLAFKKLELPRGVDAAWYVADSTTSPSATNAYLHAIGQ